MRAYVNIAIVRSPVAWGLAVNSTVGIQHRSMVDNAGGAGFIGTRSLIERNHPSFGIIIATLLFGALYQGGAGVGRHVDPPMQIVDKSFRRW
jgi:simple sugar transport system permease protein